MIAYMYLDLETFITRLHQTLSKIFVLVEPAYKEEVDGLYT